MKLKFTKEEELTLIKYLRFRHQNPEECKYTFMALKDIAKHLGRSVAHVASVCKKI